MAKCLDCGNKIERNQFKVYKKRLICLKCYKAIKAEQKRQRAIAKKLKETVEEKEVDTANVFSSDGPSDCSCTTLYCEEK